jgi:hypothetical protein
MSEMRPSSGAGTGVQFMAWVRGLQRLRGEAMMKRVRDWVQARIDAAILPQVRRCVTDVAQPVDYQRLALEVGCLQEFRRELASVVAGCDDLRAEVSRQLADRVIDQIDTSDLSEKVAGTISAEDVAYHMDAEDVAGYVEVDTDDIASKVAEEIDVSECVDYDRLAETLVSKLKEAWA